MLRFDDNHPVRLSKITLVKVDATGTARDGVNGSQAAPGYAEVSVIGYGHRVNCTASVLLAAQLFLITLNSVASEISGRVVGVVDGDTVTILDSANTQHMVRLGGIDAPEQGQPFGAHSRQHLSDLVFGKDVRVDWYKRDQYGRVVGTMWSIPPDSPCQDRTCPRTLDVGLAQITVGLAWHCKFHEAGQSEEDRLRYEFAEQEARARKAGIWSEANPVPPWEWRRPD